MSYRIILSRALLVAGLCAGFANNLIAQKPVVRIGMILDGPSIENSSLVQTFRDEIKVILEDEFEVGFSEDKTLVGDWSSETVRRLNLQLLRDPEVDVLVLLGLVATHEMARIGPYEKPVFGAFSSGPSIRDLPVEERELEALRPYDTERFRVSGVKNFNYLLLGSNLVDDVRAFHEVIPFTKLTILLMKAWTDSLPSTSETVERALSGLGVQTISQIPVNESAEEALALIPPGTDAVIVAPLLNLSRSEFGRLVEGLNSRRLPSLAFAGRQDVERGLFVSIRSSDDQIRRARRIALNIQETLEGQDPDEMTIEFERELELVINMETARKIGVSPRFSTLLKAELLNEQPGQLARTLSLAAVVREASTTNLDLAAADRNIAAGEESVREARSPLLPQVDLSGEARVIDDDRARNLAVLGESEFSASLTANQLIYSDRAWSGYTIEQRLQELRFEERAQLRLDVVLEAAEAYLGLLRAQTVETIQKDNLALTRSNLELAISRVQIGVAGREETFRWESQIATNQKALIEATSSRNQARIAVNRVLNRPMSELFGTVEENLNDPALIASFDALSAFIDNPSGFLTFSEFMTNEALAASPEIRQFDALVAAKQRELESSQRSFFLPEFNLFAGIKAYQLHGVGSELPPGLNNTDWIVGVGASLPLFKGAGRFAEVSRLKIQLEELSLQQQATSQRVEQRIRSVLQAANASYIGISLSQAQAEAARQNLELVKDSYAAGVVGILGLLDAQNQALSADLSAANAVFQYLADLMKVQRAVGQFDYFRGPGERQEFLSRLSEFYRERGVAVRTP